MLTEQYAWVAVVTYAQSERLAARSLEELGIEVYLPMLMGKDKRRTRNPEVEMPMFPCYLFARINSKLVYHTRTARGVRAIVTSNHSAIVVPQRDIDAVHAFEESKRKVYLWQTSQLVKGTPAIIQAGEFAGMQGILIRGCKDGNFAVNIEVMNTSFVIHVRRDELIPAEQPKAQKAIWDK